MNYKITLEDDNYVKIRFNGVIFTIEKETSTLCELRNDGEPTDIVIPRTFPSGHQIRCLASNNSDNKAFFKLMVKGKFGKITISDNIFVGCGAFWGANVKEIVWNDSSCIPYSCFENSDLEKVTNIENVKMVMKYAFSGSGIVKIIWPEQCDTIPEGCFRNCAHLTGFSSPYVKKIDNNAFYASSILTFDWPADCREIPEYCFSNSTLAKIYNIENVEAIGQFAFDNTEVSTLDLSNTNINYLAPSSLQGLPKKCKVVPPYYVTDRNFAIAMASF